jgi:hypothetical protein
VKELSERCHVRIPLQDGRLGEGVRGVFSTLHGGPPFHHGEDRKLRGFLHVDETGIVPTSLGPEKGGPEAMDEVGVPRALGYHGVLADRVLERTLVPVDHRVQPQEEEGVEGVSAPRTDGERPDDVGSPAGAVSGDQTVLSGAKVQVPFPMDSAGGLLQQVPCRGVVACVGHGSRGQQNGGRFGGPLGQHRRVFSGESRPELERLAPGGQTDLSAQRGQLHPESPPLPPFAAVER